MTRRRVALPIAVLVAALFALAVLGVGGAAGARSAVRAHQAAVCPSGLGGSRDPANPLALAAAPGSNPLSGAEPRFFVQTPARGEAAGAIASLLGVTPPDTQSWPDFAASLSSGSLAPRLNSDPALASKVALLSKIAAEPETSRFSTYTAGGGPGAISTQLGKFLCRVHAVAPQAIPLLSTYFLDHAGHCATETASQVATFKRRVSEFAQGVANYPTVIFAEEDAVDTSGCLTKRGLAIREEQLAYEVDALATIPHAVVYLDGGTRDANSAQFAAKILNAAHVSKIRGFFLNATHRNWASKEITFGNRISNLTHGSHFIVNTANNGHGPALNPHPSRQGVENLCNPPSSGLGPQPTTDTGFPLVDAFEWTAVPGKSSGLCHPGDPSGGVFSIKLALALAQKANGQLGPGYPSRPY